MKKYLYKGGALLAAAAGIYLLGRRSGRKALAGPEASVSYTLKMPRLGSAVARQVARAVGGSRLSDYRKAEDIALFWGAPAYKVEAYYKAAYWLAVASRLTGSASLAATAGSFAARGSALFAVPGSSFLTGSASEIMQDALSKLRPYAKVKQVSALMAALGSSGSEAAVSAEQSRVADREVLKNTATRSASDVSDLIEGPLPLLRDGLGLRRPDGTNPPWWRTWGVRGAAIAAALIGARIVFAPQYHAAKATVTGAVTRVKAARLALAGPTEQS